MMVIRRRDLISGATRTDKIPLVHVVKHPNNTVKSPLSGTLQHEFSPIEFLLYIVFLHVQVENIVGKNFLT